MVILIIMIMTTGCLGLFSKDLIEITVEVSDSEAGTVVGVAKNYKKNDIAELTAKPNKGYKFTNWSGDVPEENATDNPLLIAVTEELTITANFEINDEFITITFDPVADTHVTGDWRRGDNHGSEDAMLIKLDVPTSENNSHRKAFLKFDIGTWASVESATLAFFATDAPGGEDIRLIAFYDVTGEQWAEDELTWDNAPETLLEGGVPVTRLEVSAVEITEEKGKWYEIDLLDLVNDKLLSEETEIGLRLESETPMYDIQLYIASKEGPEETRPRLIISGVR